MAYSKKSKGNIPIIILAAGSSSRMGQSKQLLPIDEEPLLRRSINEAIKANTGQIVVVLGANEEPHRKVLRDLPVQIVSNPAWQKGMGTSIKSGIKHLEKIPNTRGAIISVCDQPHLSSDHFTKIANEYLHSKAQIVASSYSGTIGVPILFDKSFFDDLKQIKDSEGAKAVAEKNRAKVKVVDFPLGNIDLDTMEDYNTFNQ